MRIAIAGMGILLYSLTAQAITWNFNEGENMQGWITREGATAGDGSIVQALRSEVRDGIWRIQVPPFQKERNPEVLLLSPIIGYDSELFDRMTIRFRVVHTQPIPGSFSLRWTNPANLSYPGSDPTTRGDGPCANPNCLPRFWMATTPLYTTDWQEITIGDLRSRTAVWPNEERIEYDILWEGKLTEIRISLDLVDIGKWDSDNPNVQGPEEVPEAVEIDWIKLTGVQEQLQGERPPPPTPADILSGSLLALVQ